MSFGDYCPPLFSCFILPLLFRTRGRSSTRGQSTGLTFLCSAGRTLKSNSFMCKQLLPGSGVMGAKSRPGMIPATYIREKKSRETVHQKPADLCRAFCGEPAERIFIRQAKGRISQAPEPVADIMDTFILC